MFQKEDGKSSSDRQGIVTFSIMMYFTPGFEAIEPDVEGYIETMMTELNDGYSNSGVLLQAELFCVEKIDVPETSDSSALLTSFRNFKGMQNIELTK